MEELKEEKPKKKRQFNRVVFKRKDVLWRLIIKDGVGKNMSKYFKILLLLCIIVSNINCKN
jgi:hypothetical protein